MMSFFYHRRYLMVLGLLLAVVGVFCLEPRSGRSAESPEFVQGPAKKVFQYTGSVSCKRCHQVSREDAIKDYENSVNYIRHDEWKIWDQQDKHSIAYSQLKSERGQRMVKFLKIDVTKREAGCLGCHSASVSEINDRQGDLYKPSEGVSCENCHGPASDWYFPHTNKSFRTESAETWSSRGFNNLRSPDQQAEKCLSCHIGNAKEGKVVTHEMYAAGHPPLPSIEVATFTNSMPRHWWLQSEPQKAEVRKSLGYVDGQLVQTKLAMVGAAVALKTSMKLLAEEALVAKATDTPGLEWPDYARFDCWSCHHDLKRQSWRQDRGYQGPPGRVPVSEWPLAIVELGIYRLLMDDPSASVHLQDLKRYQQVIHDQANARPFGRPQTISKAADDLAKWADVLIIKLNASSFDRPIALKLLRKLVENAVVSKPDYDSARHIAWTIKLLVMELGDQLPNSSAINAIIAEFDKGLKLVLPAGREYQIEDELAEALQIISDYEPSTFQNQLNDLLKLLPTG